ncbi:hypothetical protein PB1_00110 [Bacillus methanolicus PB1]|uniref:Uncharacterized protein n=1 Tax=Bacillus methanolicus PB1 TaxID=997296 RepID=I3E482_BACMT|nr:hypothetical protein PB1_00110 [Bacillus methanolicus PB1]
MYEIEILGYEIKERTFELCPLYMHKVKNMI